MYDYITFSEIIYKLPNSILVTEPLESQTDIVTNGNQSLYSNIA